MALVLSLKQDQSFYLNDQKVTVTEVITPTCFVLELEGQPKPVTVDDSHSVEIVPEVWVAAGKPVSVGLIRVVIDAPREILILREENYQKVEG